MGPEAEAWDLRARVHPAGFVERLEGAVSVTPGVADPRKRHQAASRLEEPDHLLAQLDAFRHVVKGVVELVPLVQHLGDADVCLTRMEWGEAAVLRRESQALPESAQCRPQFASGSLHPSQGVAGRHQRIRVVCRPAFSQHLGGPGLGQPPAHPIGPAPGKPARPEARPALLLGHMGQRAACVLDHPLGVATHPGDLGAKHRDRGWYLSHHAGTGGQLEHLPLPSGVEGVLGMVQQALDPIEVAKVEVDQALRKAQRRAEPHRIVREHREPALQDDGLSAAEGLAKVLLHESRRPCPVAGRQDMPNRVVDQAVPFVPGCGSAMQLRFLSSLDPVQPGAEEIAEQVMEAVPAALLVQGDQEQVGALECLEHVLAVGIAGDRVTKRAGETLEDRRPEQERPHPVRLALQYLLAQVVEDVAMSSRERTQEGIGVRSLTEGQRGKLQAHRPPLRTAVQSGDGLRRQVEIPHLAKQRRGLVGGESEVTGPQLGELAAGTKAGEGEGRVAPAGDDDVQPGRKVT
jgi:hypothetical protein